MVIRSCRSILFLVAVLAIVLGGCSSARQGNGRVAATTRGTPAATARAGHDLSSADPAPSASRATASTFPATTAAVAPPTAAARPAPEPLAAVIDSMSPLDPEPYTGAHPNVFFLSPSRNIGCYIFIDGARSAECTIARYEFDEPGPDCPNGTVVRVDAAGTPSFVGCAEYPLYTTGDLVLPYGYSLTNGEFTCGSGETGVSCIDRYTGTGFTLSRAASTPYG